MLFRLRARPAGEAERVLRMPDGRLIGYAEFGDRDGWPVFFFHGLPGSRLSGRLAAVEAETAGARLIALERPGFGLSDDQPKRRIADWPADVAVCADVLGIERYAVAGISGGGPYALACAALTPARVTAAACISGVGPLAELDPESGFRGQNRLVFALARRSPSLARLPMGLLSLLARRLPGLFRRELLRGCAAEDRPALRDPEVFSIFLADAREAFRHGSSGAAYEAWLFTQPWDFDLGAITVPVFIWHGEADGSVPAGMGRHLAAAMPTAEATFVPGAGHLVGVTKLRGILGQLRPGGGPPGLPR